MRDLLTLSGFCRKSQVQGGARLEELGWFKFDLIKQWIYKLSKKEDLENQPKLIYENELILLKLSDWYGLGWSFK